MRGEHGGRSAAKAPTAGVVLLVAVAGVLWGLNSLGMFGSGGGGLPKPQTAGAESTPSKESGAAAVAQDQQAPPPSDAANPQGTEAKNSIKIASWNIEWLGKPDRRSGPARDKPQSPKELAEAIAHSGAAIVALQEIVAPGAGRPIRSRELDAVVEELKKTPGGGWTYLLFPGRGNEDQLTGLLWDASRVAAVEADGKPLRPGSVGFRVPIKEGRSAQGSGLWNRPPHAVKFSLGQGKTDFVVIVLHMKSDFQGTFSEHRAQEAAALTTAMAEVKRAMRDADIVLAGDTNCTNPKEPAITAFAAAGFRDLNETGMQTHWRGGTMDRFLVPSDQPEFRGSAMRVRQSRSWRAAA